MQRFCAWLWSYFSTMKGHGMGKTCRNRALRSIQGVVRCPQCESMWLALRATKSHLAWVHRLHHCWHISTCGGCRCASSGIVALDIRPSWCPVQHTKTRERQLHRAPDARSISLQFHCSLAISTTQAYLQSAMSFRRRPSSATW